ncbi:ZP domain-containing protein-like [Strongylocentrotus purpuratus]|uniref:ZP domain-containing protein n=1 Tax=Strongylocentrotus purpuratus TaxID=7668 RepID=A0A7M7N9D2_STRPU|nr:ZP domain-containing protein-like [Strongylocentrotus purpuratus]
MAEHGARRRLGSSRLRRWGLGARTVVSTTDAPATTPVAATQPTPLITDAPTAPLVTQLSTEGIILICNATHMIVQIPKGLLTGGMSGEDVRFENDNSSDCIGEDKGGDTPGDEFIELATKLTECETEMKEGNDTETYTNGVINRYVDDNGISRQYVVDIPLTCTYNRSHRAESIIYQLTDYTIDKTLVEEGAYTFSFDIYTDNTYTDVDDTYPISIGLNKNLFFAAYVDSLDGTLDLSIRSCRATPDSKYDSPTKFEFIEDGCSIDDDNTKITTLEDHRIGVEMKTIRFIDDEDDWVYIHCNLLVCDDEDDNSICNNDCALGSSEIMGRKRRDVSSKLKTKRFTRGPLRVVRSAQRQGSVLRMDASENGAATQQEFTNAFNPWIVAIAALATVVMAMAAMMAVVLRKVNKISAAPAGSKEGSARLLDDKEEI